MSNIDDEQIEYPGSVHMGHRKRLRLRFREEGLETFEPHEILELLLCYAKPRGDMNPVAHTLLDSFGSLKGVLEASPQQLMGVPGVGEEAATLISLMVPLFRRYSMTLSEQRKRITSTQQARELALALLLGKRTEQFYCICLGANQAILGQQRIADGTVTEVQAYPRRVVEVALNLGSHGVILCHNHPDGICTPSEEDVSLTRRMQRLLNELGIQLLDHVVVAGSDAYSMAEHGELTNHTGRGRMRE